MLSGHMASLAGPDAFAPQEKNGPRLSNYRLAAASRPTTSPADDSKVPPPSRPTDSAIVLDAVDDMAPSKSRFPSEAAKTRDNSRFSRRDPEPNSSCARSGTASGLSGSDIAQAALLAGMSPGPSTEAGRAAADDDVVFVSRGETDSIDKSSSFTHDDSSYDDDGFDDPITQRNLRQFPPLLPSALLASRVWPRDQIDSMAQAVMREKLQNVHQPSELDAELSPDDSASLSGASNRPSSGAKLPGLWSRLQEQRQRIRHLRKDMSSKRKAVQELRVQKDEADNQFMRLVRPHLVPTMGMRTPQLPVDMLSRRFNEMQTVRSEYNTVESEYEGMEMQMDREEKDLTVLEVDFFSLLYGKSANSDYSSVKSDDDDDRDIPPSRTSLLGISGDRPIDIHPLYRNLLDAVGDRELWREHHADLLIHREAIMYDLENRLKLDRSRDEQGSAKWDSTVSEDELGSLKSTLSGLRDASELVAKFGSSMKEDEVEFLNEFDEDEKAARDKVHEMEAEVDRLRTLCIETGAMRKNAPYHEEYTIFADTEGMEFDTMTINNDSTARLDSLANPRFPILLSNPRHVLETEPLTAKSALREATRMPKNHPARAQLVADSMKEYGIANLLTGFGGNNKSDYINRWLLQRLRMTPIEVELLFCIFSGVLKVVNKRRWQDDVLYFWPRDDANKPPDTFEGPETSRDALDIGEEAQTLVNSELVIPSRPGSDAPLDELRQYQATPPNRPTRSDPGDRSTFRNTFM